MSVKTRRLRCRTCGVVYELEELVQVDVCRHVHCRVCLNHLNAQCCPEEGCGLPLPRDWQSAAVDGRHDSAAGSSTDSAAQRDGDDDEAAEDGDNDDDEQDDDKFTCAAPSCGRTAPVVDGVKLGASSTCPHLICTKCIMAVMADPSRPTELRCPAPECAAWRPSRRQASCDVSSCDGATTAVVVVPNCGHRVCFSCAGSCLTEALTSGEAPTCPGMACWMRLSKGNLQLMAEQSERHRDLCNNVLPFMSDVADEPESDKVSRPPGTIDVFNEDEMDFLAYEIKGAVYGSEATRWSSLDVHVDVTLGELISLLCSRLGVDAFDPTVGYYQHVQVTRLAPGGREFRSDRFSYLNWRLLTEHSRPLHTVFRHRVVCIVVDDSLALLRKLLTLD